MIKSNEYSNNIKTNRSHFNNKTKKITSSTILYIIMIALAIAMLLPFYWSLITSFRVKSEILALPVKWYPTSFTWEHYDTVLKSMPFFKIFSNSVFVTLTGMFTNLFFGSLAAYSFSKIRFSGHKTVFNIMLTSMMIPGVITLIPTFMVLWKFPLVGGNSVFGEGGSGFYDTLWAVVLPGAIGVYGIFFMRQFFASTSDDYAESARIDGASELRIFLQIYIPLVLPGLLTLGIFTFQSGWNNFMWPNIVLNSAENYLLTMTFKNFMTTTRVDYGPLMAVSIMMAVPVMTLFVFAQKYFINGVALGGVKE